MIVLLRLDLFPPPHMRRLDLPCPLQFHDYLILEL